MHQAKAQISHDRQTLELHHHIVTIFLISFEERLEFQLPLDQSTAKAGFTPHLGNNTTDGQRVLDPSSLDW